MKALKKHHSQKKKWCLTKNILGIFGSQKLWKPCQFRLFSVHSEMWIKLKNKKMKKSEKNEKYCVQNPVRLGQSGLDNKERKKDAFCI